MNTEERDQLLRARFTRRMATNQAAAGNTMDLGGEAWNRSGSQKTPQSNLQGKQQ
jgi:hypothetical protein